MQLIINVHMKVVHWADGKLEGYEVECPWHGSRFDVRPGEVTNPPASEPEPTYEVKVDGNNIFVRKRTQTTQQQQKPQFELTLLEKQNDEGTDVMSFKFTKTVLRYKAGQYAYFDIGKYTMIQRVQLGILQ